MGQPRPVKSRRLPVKFAIARWTIGGFFPAFHAMTASTANSGKVWTRARMARARPWETRNSAASAPHATRNAEAIMAGKVQRAESGEAGAGSERVATRASRSRSDFIRAGYSMAADDRDRVAGQPAHPRGRPRDRGADALPARGREGDPGSVL